MEAIINVKLRKGFTVLPNSTLRDNRLSLKTRAILAIMISMPPDWDYTVSGLAVICGVGRDAIRSSLKELEEAGYLTRRQCHSGTGRFSRNEYIVTDAPEECAPLPGNPSTADPLTAEPLTENPTQQNKDYTNTPYSPPMPPCGGGDGGAQKQEHRRTPDWSLFDQFWAAYPRKKDKERAKRAWRRLNPDPALCRTMAAALERDKQSRDWRKEGGAYIPYPSTWLNGRRWEDGADSPQPPPDNAPLRPEGGRWI